LGKYVVDEDCGYSCRVVTTEHLASDDCPFQTEEVITTFNPQHGKSYLGNEIGQSGLMVQKNLPQWNYIVLLQSLAMVK
jgi:hypothetical protein